MTTVLASPPPTPSVRPTKIGLVVPLSGEYAAFGEPVRRGVELFLKLHPNRSVELITEDGGTMEPRVAVSAAMKLVDIDKVDLIAVMVIDDAEPLAAIVAKRGVPLVTLWDSSERLLKLGTTMFSVGYQIEITAEVLAEAALGENRKRVAVVGESSPWAEVVGAAFSAVVVKQGGEIVSSELLLTETKDFASIITKLKLKRPDSVLLALNLPSSNAAFL